MPDDAPHQPIQLPLAWVGVDELPVLLANQFMAQNTGPNEFVITVGQLVGPALIGTPEEQAAQAGEIAFVPVKPLTRLTMTRTRMLELIQLLNIQMERHDEMMRGLDPTGGGDIQ